MNNTLVHQLAIDYCCTMEDIEDEKNHFLIYRAKEGRRSFQEKEDFFLKVTAIHDKVLFAGRADIIEKCKERYKNTSGAWFMDARSLLELNTFLDTYGYQISEAHPFFIATQQTKVETKNYEIVYYQRNEIEQFRGDERFNEAYAFCEEAPDEIGVAALKDGRILGMAGASSDSPLMWQIGINVMPEARGNNIGPMLVTLLKNKVLELGKLPFYGTAMSHVASQKVAIKAGFLPAWSELATEKKRQ